jgi:hypothetical protein
MTRSIIYDSRSINDDSRIINNDPRIINDDSRSIINDHMGCSKLWCHSLKSLEESIYNCNILIIQATGKSAK